MYFRQDTPPGTGLRHSNADRICPASFEYAPVHLTIATRKMGSPETRGTSPFGVNALSRALCQQPNSKGIEVRSPVRAFINAHSTKAE